MTKNSSLLKMAKIISSKNASLVPSISILEDILLNPKLTFLMSTDGENSDPTAYSPNLTIISRFKSINVALIEPCSLNLRNVVFKLLNKSSLIFWALIKKIFYLASINSILKFFAN